MRLPNRFGTHIELNPPFDADQTNICNKENCSGAFCCWVRTCLTQRGLLLLPGLDACGSVLFAIIVVAATFTPSRDKPTAGTAFLQGQPTAWMSS